MKLQLIVASFIVLSSLQLLNVDCQKKSNGVSELNKIKKNIYYKKKKNIVSAFKSKG